ncbi:hypothetical protein DDQ41_07995 [Streptomyces spongiicola]|uniref:Secreted protein n=1 Tax=Streptomyces spongiicola TaxID=1690221 RepID=A0ABM6V4M3_9ACTN|nr:hypothetical protein DDQ41_07995 [Streptomyces spongiicola]
MVVGVLVVGVLVVRAGRVSVAAHDGAGRRKAVLRGRGGAAVRTADVTVRGGASVRAVRASFGRGFVRRGLRWVRTALGEDFVQ